VAVVGTLTGFLAAEGIVRLFDLAPEVGFIQAGRYRLSANPRLGYEMVPSLRCEERGGRCDFLGTSNSLGFRDREHPLRKRPGTWRLLVLGDSIAEGFRIDDDRAIFPALLEKLLRARGLDAEVLNFAVNGYDTRQEVETLRAKGMAFHPDLVLVAYCLNDTTLTDGGIMETLRSIDRDRDGRTLDAARLRPWLGESALYRYLAYRVAPAAAFAPSAAPDDAVAPAAAAEGFGNRERVAAAFADLHSLAREARLQVVVAIFPRLDALDPYPFAREHARVRAMAEADGFAVVDLLGPMRDCALAGSDSIGFDAWHPTAYGHACAAAALAEGVAALAGSRAN